MRGTVSKYLFIDSSVNTQRGKTRVMVPPHPFSATGQERMALSLVSFSMRRNWYNINANCNTFYLLVSGQQFEVVIPPGVYSTFTALAAAIDAALTATTSVINATLGNVLTGNNQVLFNATTRQFTMTLEMTSSHQTLEVKARTYAIKSGPHPAGVTLEGGFSDVRWQRSNWTG